MKNLDEDFSDGVNLCHLVEIITSKPLGFNKQPNNTIKRTENISLAVERVSHELGFKLYGLSVQDIEVRVGTSLAGVAHACRRLEARRRLAGFSTKLSARHTSLALLTRSTVRIS